MQGPDSNDPVSRARWSSVLCTVFVLVVVVCAGGGVMGSAPFPDVGQCIDAVTVNFPSTVTVTKDYLFVAKCPTLDVNQGDFVSVWVEDSSGAPIFSVSEYEATDQGVEWIGPLSDSNGNAWGHITMDPAVFDCNSTGVPYTLEVSWDGMTLSQIFNVRCPRLSMKRYREDVPFGEKLLFTVEVWDDQNYSMRGVECGALLLYDSADDNVTQIKQRHETVFSDRHGIATFEFMPGLLEGFLVEYEYESVVECLGADVNFGFTVQRSEDQYLRNPLYYGMIFFAENALVFLAFLVAIDILIGMFYLMVRSRN